MLTIIMHESTIKVSASYIRYNVLLKYTSYHTSVHMSSWFNWKPHNHVFVIEAYNHYYLYYSLATHEVFLGLTVNTYTHTGCSNSLDIPLPEL